MKKIKDFLEQWIKFEIYDTEEEGIYQIYAGVSKDGIKADLSPTDSIFILEIQRMLLTNIMSMDLAL